MKRLILMCGCAAVVWLSACGGSKTESENAAPKGGPSGVDEANAGTISGKVSLTGTPPEMKTIDMSATPACAKEHSTPQKSEEVVVNGNGTLKYVFVWVKAGVPDRPWAPPTAAVSLDQTGCMYEPHVIGVMVNQEVRVANSDSTNHNIHPLPRKNTEWNESEAPKTSDISKKFTKEEIMIPVKCNIHPWMRAYIGVVSHPFFAVTGDDGTFQIKGLPPGNYMLAAWHERFGVKEVEVTVGPKEDKTVDFSFSPKS
jgi:plastocyanin